MNLLVLATFLTCCVIANAQDSAQKFYSNPMKMLINKYPAYVSSGRQEPSRLHNTKPQHPRTIFFDPDQITISGERSMDLGKRRRVITPIRISPFFYSLHPTELDDNKPLMA